MRFILLILLSILSQPLWASCESSIIKGSHTALTKKEAQIGAMEDAAELCYPGTAAKQNLQCKSATSKKLTGKKGIQGKTAVQCVQEVVCNLCDDDVVRKYEALE